MGLHLCTMATRRQRSSNASTMTFPNDDVAHGRGNGNGLLRMLQRESMGTTQNY